MYFVEVAPLIPPFSYNNLCSSVLLTRFIPVYILVHSFQVLLPVVQIAIFMSVDRAAFPKALRPMLNGVFWPDHWSGGSNRNSNSDIMHEEHADPMMLLKAHRIVGSDILNHLLVFCTFGICSPFLALIMLVSVGMKHHMWMVLIGRFVFCRVYRCTKEGLAGVKYNGGCSDSLKGHIGGDDAVLALSTACLPIMDIVCSCVWPVVWSSGLFFSFLCWDVLGDEVGWKQALWAPVMILGYCACMWVFVRIIDSFKKSGEGNSNFEESDDVWRDDSCNPMRVTEIMMSSMVDRFPEEYNTGGEQK